MQNPSHYLFIGTIPLGLLYYVNPTLGIVGLCIQLSGVIIGFSLMAKYWNE